MIPYADRVRRGAALLDRRRPGWHREIAADRLAMEECTRCILGQLYGNYWAGYLALCGRNAGIDAAAARYGFTAPDGEFAGLTLAWREEIRARLAPKGGPS